MIDYNKEFIDINKRQDTKGFKKYGQYLAHLDNYDWRDEEMNELEDEQVCPYCEYATEDCQSNWHEDEEEVKCNKCGKIYTSRAVYKFEGFAIEKQCEYCNGWTDDGDYTCDCLEKNKRR